MEHDGGCHCGNLTLRLRLTRPPSENAIRSCQCSFCRAHATRTVSDPEGLVEIRARDWNDVTRYRFGTGTAEFLLCKTCGIYIGAVGDGRSVTNVNCLNDRALFVSEPERRDHGGETAPARLARRAANWTPAVVHLE